MTENTSSKLRIDRIVLLRATLNQALAVKVNDFKDPKLLNIATVDFCIMDHDVAQVISEGKVSQAYKSQDVVESWSE